MNEPTEHHHRRHADGADPHGLAALARELHSQATAASTFDHVVQAALQIVPGVASASVSSASRRDLMRTEATSDTLASRGDDLQVEIGQGPCLEAAWSEEVVMSNDLATEQRWPLWSRRAVEELGVRSMLCLRLWTTESRLGALNLYATQPAAFSDDDVALARTFVAHCSVAVAQALEVDHLKLALDTRTTIANAVGMLMKEYTLTAPAAFELLVKHSSHQNRKLADIAGELVRTHTRDIAVTQTLRDSVARAVTAPKPGPSTSGALGE